MASDTVTVELPTDYAIDLMDWLLFRPHNETWSDKIIAALADAGITASAPPVPYDHEAVS